MINKKIIKVSSLFFASLFFVVCSLLLARVASAAEARVYLERVGNFGARILIDSAEPINAYDIRISYDNAIAVIDSIDTSKSIVTVVPSPMKAAAGKIEIKGGSTLPFSGTRGELMTIQLKPVATGIVQFTVTQANAYLADGKGTLLALETTDLPLRVTKDSMLAYQQAKESGLINPTDKKPPQLTMVEIQANPLQYGERLLVFQALDKETGVARYEARERSWLTWSDWQEAFNPFPLSSNAWEIQIKAVDYNNNFALATVYQLSNAIWKVATCIMLLSLVILGIKKLRKNKKSGVY